MENIHQILKERDEIIDGLILSHLATLSRLYNLQDRDVLRVVSKDVYNPFAAEYIADAIATVELSQLNTQGNKDEDFIQHFKEYMSGKRKQDLVDILKKLAKIRRTKLIQDKRE